MKTRSVLGRPAGVGHRLDAQRLCCYYWICRFFTLRVEDAAEYVNGACEDDYPRAVGPAIVKRFCAK